MHLLRFESVLIVARAFHEHSCNSINWAWIIENVDTRDTRRRIGRWLRVRCGKKEVLLRRILQSSTTVSRSHGKRFEVCSIFLSATPHNTLVAPSIVVLGKPWKWKNTKACLHVSILQFWLIFLLLIDCVFFLFTLKYLLNLSKGWEDSLVT